MVFVKKVSIAYKYSYFLLTPNSELKTLIKALLSPVYIDNPIMEQIKKTYSNFFLYCRLNKI